MLTIQLEPLTTMIAAAGSLNFNAGRKTNPIYDPYYDYASGIYEASLGGNFAYCLDYGRELPSGVLSFKNYLSPEVTAVMIYGYPNVSAATLGVSDNREAYLATQLAMWMVAQAKGENTKSILTFDIDKIQATAGYETSTPRAIQAAKVLANKAMTNPYKASPTIQITGVGAKLSHVGNQMIAGPYKVATSDTKSKTVDISLTEAPASAITTDAAGTTKTKFNIGEEIYVRISENEPAGNLTLNAQAEGEKLTGAKYGSDLYYKQDFSVVVAEPILLKTNVKVAWKGLTGNIELLKVDQNNDKIQGVTFELRDLKGTVLDKAVTGADGYVRFSGLAIGEYKLVEVAAPEGYIMGTEPIVATVKTGETFKATYVNKKTNGGLKIIKTDNEKKPIEGVKFQVLNSQKRVVETITTDAAGVASIYDLPDGTYYYKEVSAPDYVVMDTNTYEFKITGNIITKNIENQIVKGNLKIVKTDSDKKPLQGVKFQILDSTKKVIEEITTDAAGIANSKSLNKGTYYYKEVSAPDNVIMDKKEYEFKITKTNEVITKNIENEIVKGSLKIVKVDENEKPLQGVKFQIMDSNSKIIETITTDVNGVAVSKEMQKGKYYYREVAAPEGIIIDSNKYEFTVANEGDIVIKNIVNKYVKGKLEILKVDDNKEVIEGVKFDILNEQKQVVDTITTNAEGKATTKDLSYGKYFYKEVSAPDYVVMDTKEYSFEIRKDGEVISKTVVNSKLTGGIKVLKLDKDTKEPIAGVRFDITNSNKEVVATIISNENGIAKIDSLKKGTYQIQEVKAPDKYIMDTTIYEFDINKEGLIIEKTIYNEQKKLPVTGGFISTDTMIIMFITALSLLAYLILKIKPKFSFVKNKGREYNYILDTGNDLII
jgi:TQXA domain-containing protein